MNDPAAAIRLRTVAPGLERLERAGWLPCHRHRDAYALIAVDGVFEQVSYAGRVHALRDLDAVVRAAQRSPAEALALIEREVANGAPRAPGNDDWEDELARQIVVGQVGELRDWAHANAIAPETLSRGFRRRFGVTPSRFRLEWRTRAACLPVDALRRGRGKRRRDRPSSRTRTPRTWTTSARCCSAASA